MTKQKNFFAPEPRFLCDICSIAVTNPICPSCLATEVEAWMTLYPALRKEIYPRVKSYLERINNNIHESTICIICNNKKAAVCPYCFTEFILRELKRVNTPKMILKEFFQFFNFDFEHTEYCKEAEKLGVI